MEGRFTNEFVMKKKVWVNGTFDIIHRGHLELLSYAATLGEVRVGIDSDRRVRELKGEERPINHEEDRCFMLLNLRHVSSVYIFDSDEELIDGIQSWSPDFFVIGSDYRDKKIIGGEFADEIVFFERILPDSTTALIEKIQNAKL